MTEHKKPFSGSDMIVSVKLTKELKPVASEISEIVQDAITSEIDAYGLIDTGTLRASIVPFVQGNRAGARSNGAPHALFVNYGTVYIKPRPAFNDAAENVQNVLQDALGDDVVAPEVIANPVLKIEGINKGGSMKHYVDIEKASSSSSEDIARNMINTFDQINSNLDRYIAMYKQVLSEVKKGDAYTEIEKAFTPDADTNFTKAMLTALTDKGLVLLNPEHWDISKAWTPAARTASALTRQRRKQKSKVMLEGKHHHVEFHVNEDLPYAVFRTKDRSFNSAGKTLRMAHTLMSYADDIHTEKALYVDIEK